MAYVIASGNTPQTQELKNLKQNLISASNYAENVNRQIDEMSDAQIESQYGIPSGSVTVFKTNIDNLVTALAATSITNIVSSLGFDL